MAILLTGVTGFLGKVLLWKILDENKFETIYVFIRSKRGLTPNERLKKLPWAEIVLISMFYPMIFLK